MLPERRLVYFVACDFARGEASNKVTLIGTYGRSIVVPKFPAVLPSLSFVGCFRSRAPKEKLQTTVHVPGQPDLPPLEESLTAKHPGDTLTVITNFANCVLTEAGALWFKYVFENGDTETAEVEVISVETLNARTWDKQ